MGICSKLFSKAFFIVSFGVIALCGLSLNSYAQSEEDILNSIGSELEDESAKKKEEARIEKEYKALKAKADAAYSKKMYDKAKTYYKQMADLKPDSEYASSRITMMDEKIAQAKAAELEKKYQDLIKQADALLASEKWAEATAKYNAALAVSPDETYPKSQITKVKTMKAEAEAAAKAALVQKKYDEILASAEKALSAKNWDVAKQKFNEAAKMKPDESYPREKAAMVDKMKAEAIAKAKQLQLDKEYKEKLTKADQLFSTKDFTGAIAVYESAKALKPSESYPTEQIKKANERIAILAENKRKAEQLETDFQKHKKEGEDAMAAKNWLAAIESFKTASALKPTNTIITGLLDQAKSGKRAEEELALKKKAEEEARVKTQKQFDSEMAQGAAALLAKNWDEARAAFNKAKTLKPDETSPTDQLAKLDQLIKEEQEAKAAAEEKRLAEEKAEQERLAEEARIAAEKKAAEEARIAEEKRLAEEAAAAAEAARVAAEAAEKARLEEEARLAAEAKAKAEEERLAAEAAEKKRLEEEARIAAEKAAEEEARLAEEKKLAEEAEKQRLAQEAEQNKKGFDQAVAEYKSAISKSEWDVALRSINAAEAFFPEDPQVAKMHGELAALKKAEQNAKEAEKAKAEKAAALEKEYQKAISAGDAALAKNDFAAASESYKQAISLKGDEDYPRNQIDVIKERELAANAEALAKQQELDKQFSDLMAQGEEAVLLKNWASAREKFTKASNLKPDSKGPKERLNDIALLEQKEKDLANAAAALEDDYNERMKNGQTALDNDQFADAKRFFFGASKLKPNETLPKDKLAETEKLWAAQVEKDKAEAAQKKAEQLENNYNGFIASGDQALQNEMWDEAIKSYQGAVQLKPEEAYPKQKLSEAKKMKSDALAQAEEERKAAEAAALAAEKERVRLEAEEKAKADLEAGFSSAMAQGDAAMAESKYKEAVRGYSKAVKLKPEDAQAVSKLADAQQKFDASEVERKALEEERRKEMAIELEKRREAARIQREAYLAELNKNSPEELAKRYPDGITEEVETEHEMVVTKSIIVENNKGRYLLRFDYPWGEHFYYLDGKKIREDAYNWNIRKYKF